MVAFCFGTPGYLDGKAYHYSRMLGVLPGYMGVISVSPDGRSILYQKLVPGTGADIMLVENFR